MAEAARDEKHAAKPAVVKLKKLDDDDDDAGTMGPKPGAAMSQKTLATALSRAIVIATLIGTLGYTAGTLFSARYSLIQAPNTSNNFVYRLDRLTGGVQFCGAQQCVDILHAAPGALAEKTEKTQK
jgi:hypothetical protein